METLILPGELSTLITVAIPSGVEDHTYTLDWVWEATSGSLTATANASAQASFEWDGLYTQNLSAIIKDGATELTSDFVVSLVRPYCDIETLIVNLGTTRTIAYQSERIARMIIESQTGPFNYNPVTFTVTGNGTDTLFLPERMESFSTVYCNDELVHDGSTDALTVYKLNQTKNCLIPVDRGNALEYPTVWKNRYSTPIFIDGYDYEVTGVAGFKFVPEDVKEACELLIQDIIAGNLKYVQKNIQQFSNTEFSITFTKGFADGTGNSIVDNLLARYKNRITPGIL